MTSPRANGPAISAIGRNRRRPSHGQLKEAVRQVDVGGGIVLCVDDETNVAIWLRKLWLKASRSIDRPWPHRRCALTTSQPSWFTAGAIWPRVIIAT